MKINPEFDEERLKELCELFAAQNKEFWLVTEENDTLVVYGKDPFELARLMIQFLDV